MTDSRANSACQLGATHNTNASDSDNFNSCLILLTSVSVIPYAGNSSEWKIPATPACFAELANSLPSLGICEPSISSVLRPIFPANPFNFKPITTEPEDNDFSII